MTRTDFSITVEIPAPQPLVWSVMADVERWPEWDGERFARQTALTRSAASRQSRADSSTPIAAGVLAGDGTESGRSLHMGQ
jgi:uncharacterized protein YndB with AHSA1/START domain